ncbi:hypothetical protein BDC45DRAFT_535503 [Circinella umbellata]|nr:hypothetical protein BDC45DRAFT_535503 [Circinella umbellata]
MGPLRAYSARCMERTVGLLGRRIKSKSAIAQNAQNQMVMLAAYRDLEKIDLAAMTMTNEDNGSESSQALNDDRIFQLGNGSNEIQIFNVHQSLLDSYDCWNLKNLVHKYWTRKYAHEQGHIIDEIIVGTVLHIQGNIFSSEINKEPKNARIRNFVQLLLVYDVYARQSFHAAQLEWGSFHGELLTFFTHKYNDYKHILCLVRIYTNLQANEAGVAYGTQSHQSHNGRLYVTHVQDIEGHYTYIPSAEHNGRYYYPIVGFVPNELKLGKLI